MASGARVILWAALGLTWSQGGLAQPRKGEVLVHGMYTNTDYGYSVVVPDRLRAGRMAAPAPQHGIVINLDHGGLWVNAEYNTLARSLDELAAAVADGWFPGDQMRVKAKTPVSLAGLPALDVLLERGPEGGQAGSARFVVAFRTVPGEVGIVYTILVKRDGQASGDEKVFSRVVESFRLTDLK